LKRANISILPAIALVIILITSYTSLHRVPKKPNVTKVNPLPIVGNFQNFKTLIAKSQKTQSYLNPGLMRGPMVETTVPTQGATDKSSSTGSASSEFSSTNVQVAGVDEADVIKNDGKYIYQVKNQQVIISEAYPAQNMKVINTLKFDKEFTPSQLYVDEKYLVVIGNKYYPLPDPGPEPMPLVKESSSKIALMPPLFRREEAVKAIVFDISDKNDINQIREVELEGSYISSRKIGSALYLVANKYINFYYIMEQKTGLFTPSYKDSAVEGDFVNVPYSSIAYFPKTIEPNYMMIGALNLDQPEQKMELSTYLGSSQNVYASGQNLYVVVTQYENIAEPPQRDVGVSSIMPIRMPDFTTGVFKFSLENGKTKYAGQGSVPGTVLNQFSMDEYDGYFRIATTKGQSWMFGDNTSKNNVYILDKEMKIAGKLEDLAPGERIYSVRFMGERGYMVTFKNVDPLFVIDLKDPKNPQVLGELKIPGYSDYLHPYDENHIIGFGKETIELSNPYNPTGEKTAYYLGMKIALFDVTDVNNPVEMYKQVIGDRGTDSELLRNHKALLFAKNKNLLAFPVSVAEVKNSRPDPYGMPQYGETVFQGAYVYNLDLQNGFVLKGKITHINGQIDNYYDWYGSGKNIERIIYIGDTLYTVSKSALKANDLTDLKEINTLSIPD
jgi:inhibitor of cysteine peptidase